MPKEFPPYLSLANALPGFIYFLLQFRSGLLGHHRPVALQLFQGLPGTGKHTTDAVNAKDTYL